MIGQIRKNEEPKIEISSFAVDREEVEECYKSLSLYNDERIESVVNIATMLTKYIMLENMVKSRPKQSAAAIADYIEEHFSEKLSVESVSRGTHISPSGIYKRLNESFGCTLAEYIRIVRIERSIELLADERLSIEKVAEAVGFSDAAYYSRSFKKIYGISPLKYRKRM
jgi:AraC-like DNA-binding protein